MKFPPFPHHLTPDERRAVKMQAAVDFVTAALKDQDATLPAATRDDMINEAVMAISISWLTERVEALEAAAEGKQDDAGRTS